MIPAKQSTISETVDSIPCYGETVKTHGGPIEGLSELIEPVSWRDDFCSSSPKGSRLVGIPLQINLRRGDEMSVYLGINRRYKLKGPWKDRSSVVVRTWCILRGLLTRASSHASWPGFRMWRKYLTVSVKKSTFFNLSDTPAFAEFGGRCPHRGDVVRISSRIR